MPRPEWLLFVSQLPASPSSLRVMVWRRMRAAGAVGLQNGVWVLPRRPQNERFLRELSEGLRAHNSSAQVFTAEPADAAVARDMADRFVADREREYAELAEQCRVLLAEIERETGRRKLTFAELEESEGNLARLNQWQSRISSRDFFPDKGTAAALRILAACRKAVARFAERVYAAEGLRARGKERKRGRT